MAICVTTIVNYDRGVGQTDQRRMSKYAVPAERKAAEVAYRIFQ